jgi:hypothetical protein
MYPIKNAAALPATRSTRTLRDLKVPERNICNTFIAVLHVADLARQQQYLQSDGAPISLTISNIN